MVKNCFYLLIEIRIPVRNIRPPPSPYSPLLSSSLDLILRG